MGGQVCVLRAVGKWWWTSGRQGGGVSREGAQVQEGTACTPPLQALQVCFPRDEAQTPSTAPRHRGPYLRAHTPCYSPTGQRFQIPVFLQKGSLLWGPANSPADPNSSVILSLERNPAPLPACSVHSSTATGLQFPLRNSLSLCPKAPQGPRQGGLHLHTPGTWHVWTLWCLFIVRATWIYSHSWKTADKRESEPTAFQPEEMSVTPPTPPLRPHIPAPLTSSWPLVTRPQYFLSTSFIFLPIKSIFGKYT